ncbi:hypothetical protein E2320_010580, partial [Naja naja]
RVKSKSLEDVVMLNVDTNTLETPFNDLSNLPSEVVMAYLARGKKGVFEGKKKKGANYRLLVPCHLPALLLLINDLMTL